MTERPLLGRVQCVANNFNFKVTLMNKKEEQLAWLADHLDQWPTRAWDAPKFTDWTWKVFDSAFVLCLNVKYECPQTIDKAEWSIECMRSAVPAEPAKPIPVEAMIDIETFDIAHNALVFQIAVILFDKDHTISYKEIWNLDFDEQVAAGRDISASTTAFHLKIPRNAIAALEDENRVTMNEFSDHLIAVFKRSKPTKIWAKGSFDFNILENLFKYTARKPPWKYYQCRELRTLMKECGVAKGDVSHTALEDCVAQLAKLEECRGVVKAGKQMQKVNAEFAKNLRPNSMPDSPRVPPTCLYTLDEGVTDSLPYERVAYRADCGYQKIFIEGSRFFPEGTCTKCKRDIVLEHDVKDLLKDPVPSDDAPRGINA